MTLYLDLPDSRGKLDRLLGELPRTWSRGLSVTGSRSSTSGRSVSTWPGRFRRSRGRPADSPRRRANCPRPGLGRLRPVFGSRVTAGRAYTSSGTLSR